MGGRSTEDITGKTFGKFLVLRRSENKNKQACWLCKCACGTIKNVAGSSLRLGKSTSCGCSVIERMTIHGMYQSSEYSSWQHMKNRCDNPANDHFENYGGRGITYCTRWESFENFLADMGSCPTDFSLDRIDVNGMYTPENCKWSTRQEQSYNRRISDRNKSGRTGVYETSNNRWIAEIRINYKKIHLGTFDTFELACDARSRAEIKYFGYTKE